MSHPIAYDDAIASLSGLIPELFTAPAKDGAPPTRRKFSLDEIRILSEALGNPHQQFPSVLIAGTNGKGSTAATLASIARASGLRVGLYTSPHLERVNERIRLLTPYPEKVGAPYLPSSTGQMWEGSGAPGLAFETGDPTIPDDTFAQLYFRVHDTAQQLVLDGRLASGSPRTGPGSRGLSHLPSYFELLTTLAFLFFAEEKVDLAVLEVGMGGRLDATNLVSPILSVITDISLDHQEWLGSTIAEITREKAGILRPHGTLVTLPQHPEANQALGEAAVALNVRGIPATGYMPAARTAIESNAPYPITVLGQQILIDSPLKGAHQHRNIALAIAASIELNSLLPAAIHHPITPATIAEGIRTTHWPGRLERLTLPVKPVGPDAPFVPPGAAEEELSTSAHQPEIEGFVKGHDFSRANKPNERNGASAPEEGSTRDEIEVILDVAHNPAGAWALRAALSELDDSPATHFDSAEGSLPAPKVLGAPGLVSETGGRTPPTHQVLVFACLKDKPLREMTQILFPLFDHVILAPIHSPRATDMADLLAAAEATGTPSTPAATVKQALQLATSLNPARIVISGSVYLVGEARHLLLNPSNSEIDSAAGGPPTPTVLPRQVK